MEKKLFDLLAAALTAVTLLSAWGIWLDDRRKRRRETQTATPSQGTTNVAELQGEVDYLRGEVNDLRSEVNSLRRVAERLKEAVRLHRSKIRELLERLSDNTF